MKTSVEGLMDRKDPVEEVDFVELGTVTEETKGAPLGHRVDAGFGLKF